MHDLTLIIVIVNIAATITLVSVLLTLQNHSRKDDQYVYPCYYAKHASIINLNFCESNSRLCELTMHTQVYYNYYILGTFLGTVVIDWLCYKMLLIMLAVVHTHHHQLKS